MRHSHVFLHLAHAHILAACMRALSCAFAPCAHLPNILCFTYTITIIPALAHSSPNNLSIVHALHMRHSHVFLRLARARTFLRLAHMHTFPRLALSARLSRAYRDMEWTAPALCFTPGPTSNMTSTMRLLLHAPWQFMLAHLHTAHSCTSHVTIARVLMLLQLPLTKCTQ
jgi:hypothetical protein